MMRAAWLLSALVLALPACSGAEPAAAPTTAAKPKSDLKDAVTITKCEMKQLGGGAIAESTALVEARWDGRATEFTFVMVRFDVHNGEPGRQAGVGSIRLDIDGTKQVTEDTEVPVGSRINPLCVVTGVEGRTG